MYGIDDLTQACRPVTLAGREFPVRSLRLREWGEVQAWLKSVAPNPVTLAIRSLAEASAQGPVPQTVQDALFRQAQEESRRWPPKVGSMAWINALDEFDGGISRFLRAALAPGGTTLDEDAAEWLAANIARSELGRLLDACFSGDPSVPKGLEGAIPLGRRPTTGAGYGNSSTPTTG